MTIATILAALESARSFIEGFEGDELQDGLPEELLAMIDAAKAAALALSAESAAAPTPTGENCSTLTLPDELREGKTMAFDFEWTGRAYGDESDRQRGIAAAEAYCERKGIDPAKAYAEFCASCDAMDMGPERDAWNGIEWEATKALAEGWQEIPDNVLLTWRS